MSGSEHLPVIDCKNCLGVDSAEYLPEDSNESKKHLDEAVNSLKNIEISAHEEIKMNNGDNKEDKMDPISVNYIFPNNKEIGRFNGFLSDKKHFSGCKWSPDGTCLLSSCADFVLRIFDLPKDIHEKTDWDIQDPVFFKLEPSLSVVEGGTIYDYEWYPFMSSWDPLTCCFISTSAGSPVHLWDAYTGQIRASYRAYDHADEVHSAISLAFSSSGERIYCGFHQTVKVFDITKPGRECEIFNLKAISGQRGIASCIAENPLIPDVFAVGTYSKSLTLYTVHHGFICSLTGQSSGLTQIKFSNDGLKIFSGARMDNEIICWDLRNPGKVLSSFNRIVTTNQRIYFDLSSDNKYLISGGIDGICRVWDLDLVTKFNCEGNMDPTYEFRAHNDCVNGVSLHTRYPIIATSSGQYHFPELTEDDEEEYMFSNNLRNKIENNIKLWWIGSILEINEKKNVDCS